ncbi:hypothetical protein HDV00_001041, partial [Rhizophlyctis rosea]
MDWRAADKNEAPPIPQGWFQGLKPALKIEEEFFINNVGLDAVMFLRFLRMALIVVLAIACLNLPILLPINYYVGKANQPPPDRPINDTSKLVQLGHQSLAQYSIAFIPDGSSFFAAHIFCAYVVSGIVFYMLYTSYRDYVALVAKYIHQDHGVLATRALGWRKWEKLQLRTILVQNIPPELQSEEKLRTWFDGLGLGEVETAAMDHDAGQQLRKVMDRREKTLKKLEHAYIDWLVSIDRERLRRLGSKAPRWYSPGRIMRLHSAPHDITETGLDDDTIHSLRPKIRTRTTKFPLGKPQNPTITAPTTRRDAIDHYTQKLSTQTTRIKQLRALATDPTTPIHKDPSSTLHTTSAFITFQSQRAAQIAVQVLLHSSPHPWSLRVRLAPAPLDVLWRSVSMPYLRRQLQKYTILVLTVALTFFWIVPSWAIASLTSLESVARVPAFRWVVNILAGNEMVYGLVQTLGPPLVLSIFNAVMPFILEALSYQQGFESNSHVEMATMDKYFFFLFFNVFFVFTLANTVWKIISTFFDNPLSIINLVSTSLPEGATFFINYIILNLILFPLELLRPQILLLHSFARLFLRTPREFHNLSLATSYLNYGILYPMHVIIFVITLCYSVIAPLILVPAVAYYAIAWVVYRNQLLFVYVKEWEGFGRHWGKGFGMCCAGLGVAQVTLAGMVGAKRAPTATILMIPLIISTLAFYIYCRRAFEKRTYLLPLDQFDDPNSFDYSRDSVGVIERVRRVT